MTDYKELVARLRVLFTPGCWSQNYRYCPAWDAELRRLMRTERFIRLDSHHAKIGNQVVWTANHPYASFTLLAMHNVRPKRSTILAAGRKLMDDYFAATQGEKP